MKWSAAAAGDTSVTSSMTAQADRPPLLHELGFAEIRAHEVTRSLATSAGLLTLIPRRTLGQPCCLPHPLVNFGTREPTR
jgi:hypothetical protein